MSKSETEYKILIPSPAGDFIYSPETSIQTWRQVTSVFSDVSFQSEDGPIRFMVDWGETAEYMQQFPELSCLDITSPLAASAEAHCQI